MTCQLAPPLPLHTVAELVGEIREMASLTRIEADEATRTAERLVERVKADEYTAASVALAERARDEARVKRERAAWLAEVLADAERDAAALRELQS